MASQLMYSNLTNFLVQAVQKTMGGNPPKLGGTIQGLRAMLGEAKAALNKTQGYGAAAGVSEKDITIKARDGYSIPLRIHAPEAPHSEGGPLVVCTYPCATPGRVLLSETTRC